MAKQYDAAIKQLVEAHPADWIALAGLPGGSSFEVIDADLSAIGPAADKVIRVGGTAPYIAHLEFQSSADAERDRRVGNVAPSPDFGCVAGRASAGHRADATAA